MKYVSMSFKKLSESESGCATIFDDQTHPLHPSPTASSFNLSPIFEYSCRTPILAKMPVNLVLLVRKGVYLLPLQDTV